MSNLTAAKRRAQGYETAARWRAVIERAMGGCHEQLDTITGRTSAKIEHVLCQALELAGVAAPDRRGHMCVQAYIKLHRCETSPKTQPKSKHTSELEVNAGLGK